MRRNLLLVVAILLSGCASKQRVVPVASVPPPAAPAASVPSGYGNLVVPPRLADGSYVTPNRAVSAAGAVWHLRAGLNVAALSCRGPQETALVAAYNGMLQRHHGAFDQAYRTLSHEHGDAAAFDGAMTQLYNYYALPAAQPALCATAQQVLAEAALLPPDGLTAFAPGALARLERSYTQVFAAQEAWLATRYARAPAGSAIVAAAAATTPPPSPSPAPRLAIDPVVMAAAAPAAPPRLAIDPAVLRLP